MRIKRLGFIISQMGPSSLNYQLIDSSNRYLREADDMDICCFFANDGPRPVQPNFMISCLFEAYGFTGATIATSLHTASRIVDYPGPNRFGPNKLFYYIYDLDWLRLPAGNKQWESLSKIYLNQKINLIARSTEHADIIRSVFKPCIGIVDSFNIEQFKKLIFEG